jgi:Uma2 family endonuclease
MSAAAAALKTKPEVHPPLTGSTGKHISWEQFRRKYLSREDRFKYEWVNGIVEKTPRNMNQIQMLIWRRLKQHLEMLAQKLKTPMGEMVLEIDSFFGASHRRPDISYFSEQQLAAIPQGNQIPQIVIEIISSTDQMTLVHKKMRDYQQAAVPVIWHIFPELQEVHVYKNEDMTICRGDKLCSAAPVLPDLQIRAKDLFA